MKLRLKEDPKEWRKATLLTALALAVITTVLRWRRVLPTADWAALLGVLAVVILCATLRPGWFRGYYRVSTRVGFHLSRWLGYAALAILFLLVLTPLGWVFRLMGKDPLQLKRPRNAETCWHPTGESSPLDRLF
jgi:hypothetical protein